MHTPSPTRYDAMQYRRCGRSGLKLPAISLGLWHNFGSADRLDNARDMLRTAFDLGITHFDLANNYGPVPGSAEENFGAILRKDFAGYRDEMVISTKAGHLMWPGPYGDWGSRKYLLASLDQSLRRMGLDYVDIFYSHRPDPNTPVEETMDALAQAVRQGKALYVGISRYEPEEAEAAFAALRARGVPCLIHQPRYSLLERAPEAGLLDLLAREGVGAIAFCPLAQGLLTDRYLHGIPEDSRAALGRFLKTEQVEAAVEKVRALSGIAAARGQSMAQMALAWVLRGGVTSALIGASRPAQIAENVAALDNLAFSAEELSAIDGILAR